MKSKMRESIDFPEGCKHTDDALRKITKQSDYPCWICERGPRAACINRFKREDGIYIPNTRAAPEQDYVSRMNNRNDGGGSYFNNGGRGRAW